MAPSSACISAESNYRARNVPISCFSLLMAVSKSTETSAELSPDPLDRRQACSWTIYRIVSARVTQLARNRAESHPLSSRVAELFSAMTRNARNQCHLAVFVNAKGLSSRSEKFAFTTNARAPRSSNAEFIDRKNRLCHTRRDRSRFFSGTRIAAEFTSSNGD